MVLLKLFVYSTIMLKIYTYTFSNIVTHIILLLFFKALKATCEQNTVPDSMILMI